EPDNLSEWLIDAAAFDAAGVDALWVDLGPEPTLDELSLAAALAVVTFRARLMVAVRPEIPDRTRDTIDRLSRGRFSVSADDTWERVEPPEGRESWRQ